MVHGGTFSEDDEKLFVALQRESESLKERLLELYLLYSVSKSFNVSTELNEIFGGAINFLRDAMGIEEFSLMLLDEESGELRIWNDNGKVSEVAGDIAFRLGEGIVGRVAETGKAILVPDASRDERFLFYKGRLPHIGSFISVPVKSDGLKIIGVLNIHKHEPNAFHESDKLFFSAVAQNLGHALQRARRFEEVRQEAMYDHLTHLYNRRFFFDSLRCELMKASRSGDTFSVIMIDIDNFKRVNDTCGHPVGDQVLVKLACELRTSMRQSDIVARLGGEEFVVLLPGTGKHGAMLAAEKFRARAEEKLMIETGEPMTEPITVTTGVATWPEDGDSHESLLSAADRFMYRGKHEGRNRVVG